MTNPLDTLYSLHQESEDLFSNSSNIEARDELSQSLTCTRDLIYRLESGEVVTLQEIEEVVAHARAKLDAAIQIVDPVAPTQRSGEHTLPDKP